VKPPFAYFGGKTRLAGWIAGQLPEHQHYVEPFGGSLAVLLSKEAAPMETVNDLDSDLVTFWRVLRERTDDLIRACWLTPHSRAEQQQANVREQPGELDDLERARRVWVQLSQGRGGVRSNTGWRHYEKPVGSTSMPRYLSGYVARMAPALERLRGVSLECRPALEVVASYGKHADVLMYVDPPYLGATRSSGGYRHEMRAAADHCELADALNACQAKVVLSGYHSPLYVDLYRGWRVASTPTNTGQGGTWSERTEVLWFNEAAEESLMGGVA
jgi:DNA adenine methylase